MAQHDPVREQIHGRLRDVLGEPEATMLTDRLVTAQEIRVIVREELEPVRQDMELREERFRAGFHRELRSQMLSFVRIMTFLNGMLGGILTLAVR